MNVARFSVMSSVFIFRLGEGDIGITKQNINHLGDGHANILLHSLETVMNFMRRLTSFNVLRVAY